MPTLNYKDVLKLLTKSSYDWRITSNFGDGDGIRQNKHDGTDFGMDRNTPLYAPTNNTLVTWEQYGIQEGSHKKGTLQDFGNTILIYIPEWNRTYALCHLQYKGIYVDMGKYYSVGTKLALSGNTGLSSGPHLHIGVCVGKATTLTDLRKRAIDFVKDTITIGGNKTVDELAKEVINGDWGNDPERTRRLTEAGYDAKAVQARVNEINSGSKPAPAPNPVVKNEYGQAVKVGSKITFSYIKASVDGSGMKPYFTNSNGRGYGVVKKIRSGLAMTQGAYEVAKDSVNGETIGFVAPINTY